MQKSKGSDSLNNTRKIRPQESESALKESLRDYSELQEKCRKQVLEMSMSDRSDFNREPTYSYQLRRSDTLAHSPPQASQDPRSLVQTQEIKSFNNDYRRQPHD